MQRKLASIQQIVALEPIENADAIVCATVLGWSIVVKKGEFKVGDRCVFFEIDSLLPKDREWAQFMAPRGYRVKTVKLRGCLSQGLALPLSILPTDTRVELNDEVTDLCGVTKYEPPAPGFPKGMQAGVFPGDVAKTDEIRLQSVLGVLHELREKPFAITVKLDGTSATYVRRSDELVVCSRNWSLKQEGGGVYWDLATKYDLFNKLPVDYCVQGEICGPGIQKNRLGLNEPDLFLFNVYSIREGRYLSHHEAQVFATERGLKTVPVDQIVAGSDLATFDFSLDNFLNLAEGKYDVSRNLREGIVVRPLEECYSPRLKGRLSFKVISNSFLLKED